jgi:integration host factor subunit alpha
VTKADLVRAVYEAHGGLSRREAVEIVDRLLEGIRRALLREGRIKISGFGRLEVVRRKARMGRNPYTGEKIPIPEKATVVLRPSPVLLRRLAAGSDAKGT